MRFNRAFSRILPLGSLIMVAVILIGWQPIRAQAPTPAPTPHVNPAPTPSPHPDAGNTAAKPKKEKRGSLILAPIPITSPTFGSGMIFGVGYVFPWNKEDKKSPPSSIGLAVPITSNGSRGILIGAQLNFSENKYRTTFALGRGRANLEFFGIGRIPGRAPISVFLKGTGSFIFAEGLRNVWKDIFIGPRYQYRRLSVSLGGAQTPGGFVIPTIDLKSNTTAIGFRILRDTRDNSFYPRKGAFWDLKGDFFAKPIGSARTYQTYKATYNGYKSLSEKQVLAYRGMACQVSDRTPFYDLCLFGSSSDLRGYTTGQFQNQRMFAGQAEFRQELKWRLGLVGFAGVGGIARTWGDFKFNELLPAAGVGLRFNLDKKNHINYRVDVGYGRVGATLTMSVTEAF